MIVVTGGSGFIGGAIVRALTAAGSEVVVVDPVSPAARGLDVPIADHLGPGELLRRDPAWWAGVDAVVHQGACTDTAEDDEALLRRLNDGYSARLLDLCQDVRVPLVYASSASVYGDVAPGGTRGERPLNPYAASKARFDALVRRRLDGRTAPVTGLRYFNVYGPGEDHKGTMSSLVPQLWRQIERTGVATLFGAGEGCGPGGHSRDFVHVDDVVAVVVALLAGRDRSGIHDCGTGTSRTFRDLAAAVIAEAGRGEIRYVPFPEALRGRYQSLTRADVSALVALGLPRPATTLESGVAAYARELRGTAS